MKVLIATDGSSFSKAAIAALPEIVAHPEKAIFKIISAVEYPIPPTGVEAVMVSAEYYDRVEEGGHKLATEFTRQAADQMRKLFQGVTLDLTTEVIDGSPVRAVIEQAESWHADLIVIGSQGYGFWSRTVLGSVSSSILHHAHCSVLVVRTNPNDVETAGRI